jgi:hypothetical protein
MHCLTGGAVQVPGDAEAALHRLQTKLLDVPSGAKRASREVCTQSFLQALSGFAMAPLVSCRPTPGTVVLQKGCRLSLGETSHMVCLTGARRH